jgi:hypothetical protein
MHKGEDALGLEAVNPVVSGNPQGRDKISRSDLSAWVATRAFAFCPSYLSTFRRVDASFAQVYSENAVAQATGRHPAVTHP